MAIEMQMPQMGESIAEATIIKWRKKVGDKVARDEIVLDISTDKVDSEIPAPAAGVIAEILFPEGAVVPVKAVIAIISGADAIADGKHATGKTEAPKTQPKAPSCPAARQAQLSKSSPLASSRFYSPLVRSLAAQNGVALSELDRLPGSGRGGRFNRDDFKDFLGTRGKAAKPRKLSLSPAFDWEGLDEKRVPMDHMRKAIAAHMSASKSEIPHAYSILEVDLSRVARYRAAHKADFNLSYTPFFLKAIVDALSIRPELNARLDGDNVIYRRSINLGCAVAIGTGGLIVPVIKEAASLDLLGLARAITDLASRARSKKLLPDEVQDGTFTLSNAGGLGLTAGIAVVNKPQVAILCAGSVQKKPVIIDDMIAVREMCCLTLSHDHRLIDGSLAGEFLSLVNESLQSW